METAPKLPDPDICRSERLKSGRDAYWCRVEDKKVDCKFSKRFGSTNAFFCIRNSDDYGNSD